MNKAPVGEGDGGVRDELDRDGGQQQPGDPGHQLDTVVGQQPVKATMVACQASWFRSCRDRPRVSPRKTGSVPGGSMITNSVTRRVQRKNFMTGL
jgi:hypothetical protein